MVIILIDAFMPRHRYRTHNEVLRVVVLYLMSIQINETEVYRYILIRFLNRNESVVGLISIQRSAPDI